MRELQFHCSAILCTKRRIEHLDEMTGEVPVQFSKVGTQVRGRKADVFDFLCCDRFAAHET